MEQRAREKHHEEYSMTNAPPVPQKIDGDGGNDDVRNKWISTQKSSERAVVFSSSVVRV